MNGCMRNDPKKVAGADKVLHFYVDRLRSSTTDEECCTILVRKVMPLLRILHSDLIEQWQRKGLRYENKRVRGDDQLLRETRKIFKKLERRLAREKLLNEVLIKQHLCIMQSILEFRPDDSNAKRIEPGQELECLYCGLNKATHRVYVYPSYAWGVYNELLRLCDAILCLGREDLLDGCAHVRYMHQYQRRSKVGPQCYCAECGYIYSEDASDNSGTENCVSCNADSSKFSPKSHGLLLCKVPFVDGLMLSSKVHEFSPRDIGSSGEHESLKEERSKIPVYLSWQIFLNIEWGLKGSRDYLCKKTLQYDTVQECVRSARLLQIDELRIEAKGVQGKLKKECYISIYDRNHILKALNSIRMAIPGIVADQEDMIAEEVLPHAVELLLSEHDVNLRLKIEWTSQLSEVVNLHSFQDLESVSGKPIVNHMDLFIRRLLESPGEYIEVDESEGANAKKYLDRANITGIISQIFIAKTTGRGAILRATRILLNRKSRDVLKELCLKVQEFETLSFVED